MLYNSSCSLLLPSINYLLCSLSNSSLRLARQKTRNLQELQLGRVVRMYGNNRVNPVVKRSVLIKQTKSWQKNFFQLMRHEPPSSYNHQTSMMPFFCLRWNNVTLLRVSLGSGLPDGSVNKASREPPFFLFFFNPNPPRLTPAEEPARSCEPLPRFNMGVPGGVCSPMVPVLH